jgi:hypothetical protein
MHKKTESTIFVDRLLMSRRVFAWVHVLFGFMAGATFVISLIVSNRLLPHRTVVTWTRPGAGEVTFALFLIAATPFVISYVCNADRIDGGIARVIAFSVILGVTSLLVDGCTALFIANNFFLLGLLYVYGLQIVAYVWLGDRLLFRSHENGDY